MKDEQIALLNESVKSLRKESRSGWDSQTDNLDSITTLEAQLRFKEIELQERG